jgi:hypothetical protein
MCYIFVMSGQVFYCKLTKQKKMNNNKYKQWNQPRKLINYIMERHPKHYNRVYMVVDRLEKADLYCAELICHGASTVFFVTDPVPNAYNTCIKIAGKNINEILRGKRIVVPYSAIHMADLLHKSICSFHIVYIKSPQMMKTVTPYMYSKNMLIITDEEIKSPFPEQNLKFMVKINTLFYYYFSDIFMTIPYFCPIKTSTFSGTTTVPHFDASKDVVLDYGHHCFETGRVYCGRPTLVDITEPVMLSPNYTIIRGNERIDTSLTLYPGDFVVMPINPYGFCENVVIPSNWHYGANTVSITVVTGETVDGVVYLVSVTPDFSGEMRSELEQTRYIRNPSYWHHPNNSYYAWAETVLFHEHRKELSETRLDPASVPREELVFIFEVIFDKRRRECKKWDTFLTTVPLYKETVEWLPEFIQKSLRDRQKISQIL